MMDRAVVGRAAVSGVVHGDSYVPLTELAQGDLEDIQEKVLKELLGGG